MGWWRINGEQGGIQPEDNPYGLWNAVGGVSSPENHYNGDRVSDHMQEAVDAILELLVESPTVAGLRSVFFGGKIELHAVVPRLDLLTIADSCWVRIRTEFLREWKRIPYVEEQEAIFNFVVNPQVRGIKVVRRDD